MLDRVPKVTPHTATGPNWPAVSRYLLTASERIDGSVPEDDTGPAHISPVTDPPDPQLMQEFGAQAALHRLVCPWRRIGRDTIVLTARPDHFARHVPALEATFGSVRMALTTRQELTDVFAMTYGRRIATAAEQKLAKEDSCRTWNRGAVLGFTLLLGTILAAFLATLPIPTAAVLCTIAVGIMGVSMCVKAAAVVAAHGGTTDMPPALATRDLPTITIFVPLFREREIAGHLVDRLHRLDYPRHLLDICLVLEADDTTTRLTLQATALPDWIRSIIVPAGALRTKPRALNYALDFARGSIVGVYDAEDAPAPDQLRVVAAAFANADSRTACLQGTLDYYNPRANWLTRCFTLEYAGWFRVVLPGMARLGLAVPLGGTTLFFKRTILEKLGGWDAHNVTEDADLGIRLARRGYKTVFIPSVTEEEANGRALPWIKQRSRWLKGYAITYAVHMRRPFHLLKDLGLWRFFGVQVLFLGTLAQFVLSPLLWSFWLIPLGLPHPMMQAAPFGVVLACTLVCVASAAINLTIHSIGAYRAQKRSLIPWTLTMALYFPLGALAVYKGLAELLWKPFYWDKTSHGVLMPKSAIPPPRPPRHPV